MQEEHGDPAGPSPVKASAPSRRTQVLRALVTLGVLVAVFVGVLPRFADYSDVVPILRQLTISQMLILAALAAWFLAAYWLVLVSVLPSLRLREAAVNQLAGTAVSNTVPAGGAVAVGVNYSMYLSWGFPPERIWAGLLTAGVWDGLVKAGLPLAAITLVAFTDQGATVNWVVPIVGAALLAGMSLVALTILRSESGARLVGRYVGSVINPVRKAAGRAPIDLADKLLSFRSALLELLRRSWGRLTLAMLSNHLAMFALFVASLRFTGVDSVGLAALLLAFSLARLLSGVPITPGGIGVVDAGYVALLSLSTTNDAGVVAGVLLFRALTFFPPIPLGLAGWLFWRANRSWRKPAGSRTVA